MDHGEPGQLGPGGPTLAIAPGVRSADVFAQIDTGLGGGAWCALAPGFAIDLPAGVLLLSAAPGDADPLFELHLLGGDHEFVRFIPRPVPGSTIKIAPAPQQQLVSRDPLNVRDADGPPRQLACTEVSYQHQGESWRQLFIAVPLGSAASVILSAQARQARAAALFAAARHVAATLGPFG